MPAKNKIAYDKIRQKLLLWVRDSGSECRKLPSLRQLANQFQCTHPTVLRAVRSLVVMGQLNQNPDGSFTTKVGGSSNAPKLLAITIATGMYYGSDSYFTYMRFHSTFSFLNCGNYLSSEILLENAQQEYSRFKAMDPSAVLQITPSPEVVPEARRFCREKKIPYAVFGSLDDYEADLSACYELSCFDSLLELFHKDGLKKILFVSVSANPWNPYLKQLAARVSSDFKEIRHIITEDPAKVNTFFSSKKFDYDAVVFLNLYQEAYEILRKKHPECRIVMPEFGAYFFPGYDGYRIDFNVKEIGELFGKALDQAILGKPFRSRFKFSGVVAKGNQILTNTKNNIKMKGNKK